MHIKKYSNETVFSCSHCMKLQALKSEKLSGKLSELVLNLKLSELF